MTIKHILVPTYISEYADYALDDAIEMAQKLQALLTLIYVMETMPLEVAESASNHSLSDCERWKSYIKQRMAASLPEKSLAKFSKSFSFMSKANYSARSGSSDYNSFCRACSVLTMS